MFLNILVSYMSGLPEAGLTRRSIFILPSRYGIICLFVVLGMLLGAVNYANNLAYAISFLLGSMGLVSIFHTYRNLAGLNLGPASAEPVFAGQKLCFELRIRETTGRSRATLWLKKGKEMSRIPEIEPFKTASGRILVPTSRRGIVNLGRFSLLTLYPLGLFRAWSGLHLQASGLVYPAPMDNPLDMPDKTREPGAKRSDSAGRPGQEDFQDLKEYEKSESYKRINWKSYAKEQGLLVKRFSAGSGQPVWLDWLDFPGRDTETRLSILCSLVLKAHSQGRTYGLRLPGNTIPPSGGQKHRDRCLQSLALFEIP